MLSLSPAARRCLGHPLHSVLQQVARQPVRWEVRLKKKLSDDASAERRQRAQPEQALAADRNQRVSHRQLARDAVVARPLKRGVRRQLQGKLKSNTDTLRVFMDRKALIREYKETQRPIGIYCIRNTVNGKLLVGTSRDLPSILNRQRAELRMGSHTNQALRKDLDEYGAEAFEVEVLDTLTVPDQADYDPSADLRILEQMWLEKLSPYGERGYNPEPKRAA